MFSKGPLKDISNTPNYDKSKSHIIKETKSQPWTTSEVIFFIKTG